MIRVFCDFDGTISTRDIGNLLFRAYAGEAALENVERYLRGELSAQDYYRAQCAAVEHLTREDVERLADRCPIDPAFGEFVEFCSSTGIPVTIVSDGFDAYVKPFLHRHGFSHLTLFVNTLEFEKQGERTVIRPVFPYTDSECQRCANCKRNHLLNGAADEDVVVYIGDGYSDRCPARYADIVFAKGQLIPYCQQENITYHAFTTFADVQLTLRRLLQRNRVKQRREALHARRAAFLQG